MSLLSSPFLTDKKPIFVFGAAGMLGRDVVKLLERKGIPYRAFDRVGCDITDISSVRNCFSEVIPLVVLNLAAYTNVNGAESHVEEAFAANGAGAGNLSAVSAEYDIPIIYVSTDYVFDGLKSSPYETYDDVNPLNVYGASKLEGEHLTAANNSRYLIVRTSWVFGVGGNNFVETMLKLARDGKELSIVADQIGAPTYTVDLAECLLKLAGAKAQGIVHATGSGVCSWYEFAGEIFRQVGIAPKSLKPVGADQFPTPAKRPSNSRLSAESLSQWGVSPLPDWKDALNRYLLESGELVEV